MSSFRCLGNRENLNVHGEILRMGNRSFPFNMWLYRNKSLSPSGLSHVQEDPCPVVACRQDLLSFEIIHTVKSINWILFLWKTVPSASTKYSLVWQSPLHGVWLLNRIAKDVALFGFRFRLWR